MTLRARTGLKLDFSATPTPTPGVPPVNTSLPTISGTARVGVLLTGTNGSWTNSPTSYAYQWKANGTNISGATSITFTPTNTQIGQTLTLQVIATNTYGDSSPATSSATSAVLPAVPVNSVAPAISGTTIVGQTLSTTTGTWSNTPTAYAYQWKADGVNISGATNSTFLLTSTQLGAMITVSVTASNAGGSGSPATSSAVGPVTSSPPAGGNVYGLLAAITQ